MMRLLLIALAILVSSPSASASVIDHVTDGDTIVLSNGQRVRLVMPGSTRKVASDEVL